MTRVEQPHVMVESIRRVGEERDWKMNSNEKRVP